MRWPSWAEVVAEIDEREKMMKIREGTSWNGQHLLWSRKHDVRVPMTARYLEENVTIDRTKW